MNYLLMIILISQARWGNCSIQTKKIVDRSDRIMFAKTSAGKMVMTIVKKHTSKIKMKFWSEGRDKMHIRIAYPAKLKGLATLKLGSLVWYYMPRTDRLVRIGSSMLGDSWMGSHITNDDLVKETEIYKHYTCVSEKSKGDILEVVVKPLPSAPVVWNKILLKIRKQDAIPIKFLYYNAKGSLVRIMKFKDIKIMDGRKVPTRLILHPVNKPNEYTELHYIKLKFNVQIPKKYFSLQGLKH